MRSETHTTLRRTLPLYHPSFFLLFTVEYGIAFPLRNLNEFRMEGGLLRPLFSRRPSYNLSLFLLVSRSVSKGQGHTRTFPGPSRNRWGKFLDRLF